MRAGFVTWIAVWLAAGTGVAVAQPVSPPPVEGPPIGAPATAAPAAAMAPEDPRPGEALTLCASGQVTKGIEVLAALYAETRNPSFVFNQARCYQQNGQLEKARERFSEYLRVGKNEPPADIKRAEGFIEEIDRELARRMAIQDARPRERRYRSALRTTSIVLAATSFVAFGTGAFLSYRMKSKEDQIAREFDERKPGGPNTARVSELVSDGSRLETWQYVSYGIGVAALAGAATTFGLSGWSFRDDIEVTPVLSKNGWGGVVQARF